MSESANFHMGPYVGSNHRRTTQYSGAIAWLERHGCSGFKIVNDYLMCTCPLHSERRPSFGLIIDHEGRGNYRCFACERSGSIRGLIQALEGPFVPVRRFREILALDSPVANIRTRRERGFLPATINALNEDSLALYQQPCSYWGERGLAPETVLRFGLGWDPSQWCVTLPVRRIGTRELIGVCFRYWDTHPQFPDFYRDGLKTRRLAKYHYLPGTQPTISLFGQETVTTRRTSVYLFEGAIDAANFYQRTGQTVFARWGNALSIPQRDHLRQYDEVIIVADRDAHGIGQATARSVYAQLIRVVRARIVIPPEPYKDYTEAVLHERNHVQFEPLSHLF